MEDIRIAAVIFNSAVCQVQRNLERMLPWIQKAARQGADLVCFPELNVTGYTTDAVIRDCAEPIPGPISRRIAQMAADEKIVVLAGLAERDEKGRIFASHLKASPRGDSGVYRKLYISPPEQSLFSAGRTIPLFDANGVKFGVQLCYDAHFPELSARMAVKGADIIFIPHSSPRGTPWEKLDSWMWPFLLIAPTSSAFMDIVFISRVFIIFYSRTQNLIHHHSPPWKRADDNSLSLRWP